MLDEAALLRQYAESRNEAAFAAIVEQHFDGVYSAALRRVGSDAHLAKDVAQEVFAALARSASRVSSHPVLSAWLYTTTRNIAALTMRRERRRKAREKEATAMHNDSSQEHTAAEWSRIGPMLDRLVDDLGEVDRRAILLRFIEHRSFAEVGTTLGLSENAARMRVDRALDKLRAMLRRQGILSTSSALAAVLMEQAVIAAPVGLAADATATALASSVGAGATGYLTYCIAATMNTNKVVVGVTAILALVSGVGIAELWTNSRTATMVKENQRLERLLNGALSRVAVLKSRVMQNPTPSRLSGLGVKVRTEMLDTASDAQSDSSSYHNAGRATPRAALETFVWASDRGDTATLAKSIVFGGNGRQRALAVLAALPQEAQAQFSTPEELYALFIADDALAFPPPPEDMLQSVSVQFAGADSAILTFPGQNHQQQYQLTADGWKYVFPEVAVEQFANSILSSQRAQSPAAKGN